MKKLSIVLFSVFAFITVYSCTDLLEEKKDEKNLTGVWYAPGCGNSKATVLTLTGSATSGTGSLSSMDCQGICDPIILTFSYKISGSTMAWSYDATQAPVRCTGYASQSPKVPAGWRDHSISNVSAKSFTLDSQVFNR